MLERQKTWKYMYVLHLFYFGFGLIHINPKRIINMENVKKNVWNYILTKNWICLCFWLVSTVALKTWSCWVYNHFNSDVIRPVSRRLSDCHCHGFFFFLLFYCTGIYFVPVHFTLSCHTHVENITCFLIVFYACPICSSSPFARSAQTIFSPPPLSIFWVFPLWT